MLGVGARITSANQNQKWMEVPGDEDDGIDLLVEFTDEDGKGIGKSPRGHGSGDRRQETGDRCRFGSLFPVSCPLIPCALATGSAKQEFADVRWMEITSVLQRESANGPKPVKQIEFKSERLDLSSVRRWRERVLGK